MAELYLKQGHPERALGIYERLAGLEPDNGTLAQRLAELRATLSPPPFSGGGRGDGMSFRESLQRLVDSVPGALSAVIMGFDGIGIDAYDNPQAGPAVDMQTLMVEYSSATQQLRRAAEETPAHGQLLELAVTREGNICLLRPLSQEYFMAVVMRPDGLVGKARYLLRITAPQIQQDLF